MASTVTVNIVGDASNLKRALGEAEGGVAGFSSKMKSASDKLTSFGAKMSIGVTAPLALLGKASFDAASDLNESLSKVGVVFDDMGPKVIKWSKDAATAMGMSQQAALEAAGTFGNFFQAMGVYQGPATEMSLKLVQLAADLASFNNANPEEVLLALRSGLAGEAEPLRKFGVSLSAARVEAEALATGLSKPVASMADVTEASIAVEKANTAAAKALNEHGAESLEYREAVTKVTKAEEAFTEASAGKTTELTAAQKAQAAYSIIMKDTAMAQGDFARTADGAANKQRILAAQMKDMEAQLGQALIPIFQQVAGVLQDVAKWFSNLSPEVQQYIVYAGLALAAMGPLSAAIGGLAAVLGAVLSPIGLVVLAIAAIGAAAYLLWTNWDTVWNWIKNHPAIAIIISILAAPIASFVLIIGALHWLYENWQSVWSGIQSVTSAVWSVISPTFYGIVSAVEAIISIAQTLWEIWTAVWGAVSGVVAGVGAAVSAGLAPIIEILGTIIGLAQTAAQAVADVGSFVTGSSGNIADVPTEQRRILQQLGYGAEGAIVTRPTLAMIGEGSYPEAVVPLDRMPGASALPGGGGGGSDGPTVIQVMLDGKVLTEAVVANLNRTGAPKISPRAIAS